MERVGLLGSPGQDLTVEVLRPSDVAAAVMVDGAGKKIEGGGIGHGDWLP
jgi:hypothetical protein